MAAAPQAVTCGGCRQTFPRVGGIPVLLPRADEHVLLWRRQLRRLIEQGERSREALSAASEGELLPASAQRLTALAGAVAEQVEDVVRVLEPALGGPASEAASALPRGVVEYIGYLYRDWAWPQSGYCENEQPLEALRRLIGERELGRTLVLGAGACGLAYELHRRHGASQTVALDIDPYLLVFAEQLVRGQSLRLTEASLKLVDNDDVCRNWQLEARSGSLDNDAFFCLFADGTTPPFAHESFDTVVTPWFIDQVPRDLPAFVGTLRRLLRPGGRWLNQGPLVYPEQTPFEKRYARQELFELTQRAGLRVGDWSRSSQPYLVSPLTGNGKLESVLSFVAVR